MDNLSNKSADGFTLYELLVVIAIIGALAAIALPNFLKYRGRGYDSEAVYDARNAYTTSQLFFTDHDQGSKITNLNQIEDYGFKKTKGVEITISGGVNDLIITSKHVSSKTIVSVDANGTISY